MNITKEEALAYHKEPIPGKLSVANSKPFKSQRDLATAYTPGVAFPCKEIERDNDLAYDYTSKGNLVAVITNSTAVLGLGDIGAVAGKPVMEGKGVLFKEFADVDVFDIEVDEKDPDKFCEVVEAIAKTFGGINLEDIKAPECFQIEERLKKNTDIPVMHDDQHGTAIVVGAALLNAVELAGKAIGEIRVVINGAGAAAIACGKFIKSLGVRHILMCDSKGVITTGRNDLNPQKELFAADTPHETLAEALSGADLFLGVSKAGALSEAMVASMAKTPIIFAMANPVPEIMPDVVAKVRGDAIMATGRSDFPNQINNVLGFPFIFRGALDVRSTAINEEMKIAAAKALAALAREPVPEEIRKVYGRPLSFSKEYIIPTPFDPRLITTVTPAVAQAAVDTGVSRLKSLDIENYVACLSKRLETKLHCVTRELPAS